MRFGVGFRSYKIGDLDLQDELGHSFKSSLNNEELRVAVKAHSEINIPHSGTTLAAATDIRHKPRK